MPPGCSLSLRTRFRVRVLPETYEEVANDSLLILIHPTSHDLAVYYRQYVRIRMAKGFGISITFSDILQLGRY